MQHIATMNVPAFLLLITTVTVDHYGYGIYHLVALLNTG